MQPPGTQAPAAGPARRPGDRVVRRVAALTALEAVSLAVASALHLSGRVAGRAALFDPDDAGIAEALIGAVLAATAVALALAPGRSRRLGLAGIGFAIAGFAVGLSITARAGHLPDIAYHLCVLPLLIGSAVALLRAGGGVRNGRPAAPVPR